MQERKWLSFTDSADEDVSPTVVADRKTELTKLELDAGGRVSLTVRYTLGGVWDGAVEDYRFFEVPGAARVDLEGAPAVPTDGVFVAIPDDAADVQVRVLSKQTWPVEDSVDLVPAPKQYIEAEFFEEYTPDPELYDTDEPFPGRDFDYIGDPRLEGIRVAHILVYLGQYKPRSKALELVRSMDLEVSYVVPPRSDREPPRRPRDPEFDDLIVGLDLLDDESDFSGTVEDFSDFDETDIESLIEGSSEDDYTGVSWLDSDHAAAWDPRLGAPVGEVPGVGTARAVAVAEPLPQILMRPVLRRSTIISEYVIITTPALASAVGPLLQAKTGWPHYARIALTTTIQAEFPQPQLKESIRDFVRWANEHWRCPPRFVVLAGDTDVIPIHHYSRGGVQYASDHYYADLEGDLVPEITVSRLPSSNAAELKQMCQYMVKYPRYRAGDWGGWQNKVMLCAYQASTYETTCDQVATKIGGRYKVIKRYAKNTSKNDVVSTMNAGVLFAVYRGHGSKTAWSSSNGLNTADIANLSNGGKPPFVLNICCQNGWVDDNAVETVSETFVRDRKAVAVFASSRNSWTYPNNDFIKYIFDAVMIGGRHQPAGIIRYAKTKMLRNHPTSSYHHDNLVMYNLFGDPTASVASHVEFLRGQWSMDHDGWKGTLNIKRIFRYRISTQGAYKAPMWDISGDYTSTAGARYPFTGTIGGFDSNQLGPGSKRSDHKLAIRIRFAAGNNQEFIGYVHTWSRNVVSGLTWWANHPFGWNASKM